MSGLELSRRQVLAAMGACGLVVTGCSSQRSGAAQAGSDRGSDQEGRLSDSDSAAASGLPAGLVLARRFTFGPTPDLIELGARGPDAFMDALLDPDLTESDMSRSLLDSVGLSGGSTDAQPGSSTEERLRARRDAVDRTLAQTLVLSAWSPDQLRAVMADFFADHLHVTISEAPEVLLVPAYDAEVIRAMALGRFSDLLVASARSVAMLEYLDNRRSRADGDHVPNENYARELLELHTVGVDGGYDEADVVETAHVLSGWTTTAGPAGGPAGGQFRFRPTWHDLGPAAEGDILGWRPSGRGEADGEDLLNHLARHPACARHLAWKLAVRFVADDVAPDAALVDRLADVYLTSDTEIGPVLRELAASEELGAAAALKLRRPLDVVVAMMRLGFAPPPAGDPSGTGPGAVDRLRQPIRQAVRSLNTLGQVPYRWPAPDGFPERAGAWSGAGAVIGRWNAAAAGASGFAATGPNGRNGSGVGLTPRPEADGADPRAVAVALLGTDPTPALEKALATAGTDPAMARALTFASPEFQLR